MTINLLCSTASGLSTRFPCDLEAPAAVSVGIGAGGIALLFVVFLLFEVSWMLYHRRHI